MALTASCLAMFAGLILFLNAASGIVSDGEELQCSKESEQEKPW